MNGHTATLRSLGTTGVLLLLALVLLAIVSAIVAFDRWPQSGGASTVERVAVDRPDARRVETVRVSARRSTSVVRGVSVERTTTSAVATPSGAGGAILVGDRESALQSDGGGFGPPPPAVPFTPPGEGGGPTRFTGTGTGTGGGTTTPPADPPSVVRRTACEALGQTGAPLDPTCPTTPGERGSPPQVLTGTVQTVTGTVADGSLVGLELVR